MKNNAKPWNEFCFFGVGTLIIKPSSDTKKPPGSPKMRKTTFSCAWDPPGMKDTDSSTLQIIIQKIVLEGNVPQQIEFPLHALLTEFTFGDFTFNVAIVVCHPLVDLPQALAVVDPN